MLFNNHIITNSVFMCTCNCWFMINEEHCDNNENYGKWSTCDNIALFVQQPIIFQYLHVLEWLAFLLCFFMAACKFVLSWLNLLKFQNSQSLINCIQQSGERILIQVVSNLPRVSIMMPCYFRVWVPFCCGWHTNWPQSHTISLNIVQPSPDQTHLRNL